MQNVRTLELRNKVANLVISGELNRLGNDELEFVYDAICSAMAANVGDESEINNIQNFYNVPEHQRQIARSIKSNNTDIFEDHYEEDEIVGLPREGELEAIAEANYQDYVYTKHSKVRVS